MWDRDENRSGPGHIRLRLKCHCSVALSYLGGLHCILNIADFLPKPLMFEFAVVQEIEKPQYF